MNPPIQPPDPNPPRRRQIPVEFVETRQEYEVREITGMKPASDALHVGVQNSQRPSLFPVIFKTG